MKSFPGIQMTGHTVEELVKDEKLLDLEVPFTERLMKAAPVFAPGEDTYSSIDGRYPGKWGEPMKKCNSSAQDFAFTAKSVRMCKFG